MPEVRILLTYYCNFSAYKVLNQVYLQFLHNVHFRITIKILYFAPFTMTNYSKTTFIN